MPGGVGGQRRKPLPTRLEKQYGFKHFPVGDRHLEKNTSQLFFIMLNSSQPAGKAYGVWFDSGNILLQSLMPLTLTVWVIDLRAKHFTQTGLLRQLLNEI